MTKRSFLTLISDLLNFRGEANKKELNRANVISLLKILHQNLSEITSDCILEGEDRSIVSESSEMTLMSDFIRAFENLDNGKSDTVFEPSDSGSGATLGWRDQQVLEMLVTAVATLKSQDRFSSQDRKRIRGVTDKAAVAQVAKAMRELGVRWKGKPIDQGKLLTAYRNRQKNKNLHYRK